MVKNEPIEISQVGNGFIIRTALRVHGSIIAEESQIVFQSLAGMLDWLSDHFDHRAHKLLIDMPNE